MKYRMYFPNNLRGSYGLDGEYSVEVYVTEKNVEGIIERIVGWKKNERTTSLFWEQVVVLRIEDDGSLTHIDIRELVQ